MKTIKKNIFILPSLILLLSACSSTQTTKTSMNDNNGQRLITEENKVVIDPSVAGIFSRLINVVTGKPIIEAEPVTLPSKEKVSLKKQPEPIVEKPDTEKEPTKTSGCILIKITGKIPSTSISIDC